MEEKLVLSKDEEMIIRMWNAEIDEREICKEYGLRAEDLYRIVLNAKKCGWHLITRPLKRKDTRKTAFEMGRNPIAELKAQLSFPVVEVNGKKYRDVTEYYDNLFEIRALNMGVRDE